MADRALDSRGFLIVASRDRAFLHAAVQCAESIRDHWPDANICLATHEGWIDSRVKAVATDTISPVPDHRRAKLWALPRTPYRLTQYVDADMWCVHDDVRHIFDIVPGADWLATENRAYASAVVYFDSAKEIHWREGPKLHDEGKCHRLRWHCGFFRYNLAVVEPFLHDWLRVLLDNHKNGSGKWGPQSISWWDTFAFWRCFREFGYAFAPQLYPEPDGRWQFIPSVYRTEELQGTESVFEHYTIPHKHRRRKRGDGNIEALK